MLISWENMMDIITEDSIHNGFIETFNSTANHEKVTICLLNDFISGCLGRWLDSHEFDISLKSSAKSEKTRLDANEEFKKNRLDLCCKLYTKAAQFAPHQSLEMALALSNRSVIYMKLQKFEDCVKDINATLKLLENTNSSEKGVNKGQLIVKLMKRKIDCLIALKQYVEAQNFWENLMETSKDVYKITLDDEFIQKCNILSDHDKNDTIEVDTIQDDEIIQTSILTEDLIKHSLEKNDITLPFQSSKLKLCITEDKGRHLVASENIKYGELLIFENPFAFVLLPDYYDSFCYNCCVPLQYYSVPCNHCCSILFCGEKCREESWDSYHRWECKQGTSIFKRIGIAHLALRLTFETLHSNRSNDQICNLVTHIEDFKSVALLQFTLTATLLLLFLQKKTDFFETHSELVPNLVGNELLQHMTRLVCNGNAISSHMLSDYDSETLTSIIDESQPRIGTAIFPTSSLLNHSCDPNVFSSNILKYVVIKASRDIKKGEEVTNCYGPHFRRMKLDKRLAILKSQYHFDCKCCICIDPCIDKFFQIIEGLKCPLCNTEIEATLSNLDVSDSISCNSCPGRFRSLDIKRRLIKAEKNYNKGLKLINENSILRAIEMMNKSLQLYAVILNKNNSSIAKCEDSLAKCFALVGDFENCYLYMNRHLEKLEECYGKNSLEVAYELDKISDIMVNNMDIGLNRHFIQKALAFIRRSKEIFHANLSAWDIPYNEPVVAIARYKENLLLQLMEGIPQDRRHNNKK